jgi:hypothetical protein
MESCQKLALITICDAIASATQNLPPKGSILQKVENSELARFRVDFRAPIAGG